MILGLDLSTSCTGWSIYDKEHDELISYGFIRTPKSRKTINTIFDQTSLVVEKLQELKEKYRITEIWIEDALKKFSAGKSTASTIAICSKYNGMISAACWMLWLGEEIIPQYVGPRVARKKIGLKVPRGSNAKEVVLKHILDTEPSFVVELTRFGNVQSGFFDAADAIVIAKAGSIIGRET